MNINKEAGEKSPEATIPELKMVINAAIAANNGLRVELQDGMVKTWPRMVLPSEDNWNPAEDFSGDAALSAEALDSAGAQFVVKPEKIGFSCALTFRGELKVVTAFDEPSALALAVLYVIMKINGSA